MGPALTAPLEDQVGTAPVGTALRSAVPGWEMLGQPKHTISPVPVSQAGNCLLLFLPSAHLSILALCGRGIFAKLSVHLHDPRPPLPVQLPQCPS